VQATDATRSATATHKKQFRGFSRLPDAESWLSVISPPAVNARDCAF
jgi:hypothetical protein